jgi:hypothetical protein
VLIIIANYSSDTTGYEVHHEESMAVHNALKWPPSRFDYRALFGFDLFVAA